MLDYDELEQVIDEITRRVILANRTDDIEELLDSWGMSDLIYKPTYYETEKDGKIVVIGDSKVCEKDLIGITKKLGLDPARFEFYLEYKKAKTYPFDKLQYDLKYRLVMCGPLPHSTSGKHDAGCAIEYMKKKEGFPRIEELRSGNELKITKSNFESKLRELVLKNYL